MAINAKFGSDAKTEGLWGTKIGARLRDVLQQTRRPLLWSDGDSAGAVIDPRVGAIDSVDFTQAEVDAFDTMWGQASLRDSRNRSAAAAELDSQQLAFAELYAQSDPKLQFVFPSYLNKAACETAEKDNANLVLGTNMAGDCVAGPQSWWPT